ncbi:conserved integral membrane leucine and alanine rich domain protein [Mycobacterium xenopi 4042]|uniref:Conserved integral membrane leucine and alanine rich domain protein n=1 Tax=Mycobacterium xenopi 4042 TaxID=1299334 RepID=X7YVE9_MYCXE|nr:conserved integral membrane leucine and alanine rich domain protein [Mycobacterium xenopi 4042]
MAHPGQLAGPRPDRRWLHDRAAGAVIGVWVEAPRRRSPGHAHRLGGDIHGVDEPDSRAAGYLCPGWCCLPRPRHAETSPASPTTRCFANCRPRGPRADFRLRLAAATSAVALLLSSTPGLFPDLATVADCCSCPATTVGTCGRHAADGRWLLTFAMPLLLAHTGCRVSARVAPRAA